MADVLTSGKRYTAAEFERLPAVAGVRQELVDGAVGTLPRPGFEHGVIAGTLFRLIANHVAAQGLGFVCAAETGFRLGEATVRAADVAFVAQARVPATRVTGYLEGAPELAVEVRSPTEGIAKVMGKLRDWLDNGAREAWLVDPDSRSITVYATGAHPISVYHAGQTIETGDWLGQLRLAVDDVFPRYDEEHEPQAQR